MKGAIKADHIPVNKYKLIVLGLPPLTPTEISGIEDTLQTVTLPDRTVASGGNREASECTMMIPMHHTLERLACEAWYREGQEPVLPSYKKVATLIMSSGTGTIVATYSLVGVFITKRTLPDLEMEANGEMAQAEYALSIDDILPL
jgi:uncharacterized membrane-anchored protein